MRPALTLGARDVAVHVDAAGHHDATRDVDGFEACRVRWWRDNFAVLNPYVADFAVDLMGLGVMDPATGEPDLRMVDGLVVRAGSGLRFHSRD